MGYRERIRALREDRDLTQRQIAEQCGISRSYVSRNEKKALRAIREALDGKDAP